MHHPYMLVGGLLLGLIGFLLWRWASRHDLKGLAIDAAWQVAKSRGNLSAAAASDIGRKLEDLRADGSNLGRAAKVTGLAARHFLAQVASISGLVSMLGGAALVSLAFWLR